MSLFEIKPINDQEHLDQIETIQREAWGMSDLEMFWPAFLHVMQYHGACLMGAFDGEKLIGFIFGLLGTVEGLDNRIDQVAAARLQMYSVIMGVLPEYQLSGVGYQLKKAQREFALRIGVRLVTWTYDPLESRNGYFNLIKLGVISHEYIRNYHGEMSGINVGMPTDRLLVEWWVTSNRVKSRITRHRKPLPLAAFIDGGAILVNESKFNAAGLLTPPNSFKHEDANILLVEIPATIQDIKKADMPLARLWREHTRDLFEYYFLGKYLISDFVRHVGPDGEPRSYYVMTYSDA